MSDQAAPEAALHLEEVTVRHSVGGEAAVSEVSLTLAPGEGLVVSGAAGSGKSSLLAAIAGLVPFDGEILVHGAAAGTNAARARIGFGPAGWPYAERMRSGEVLRLVAELRGDPAPEALAARVGLARLDGWATELEVEDARRLSLACAIAGDPDVLILDDPWEFPQTLDEIAAARARGAAVLVASPDPGGLTALLGRELALPEVQG